MSGVRVSIFGRLHESVRVRSWATEVWAVSEVWVGRDQVEWEKYSNRASSAAYDLNKA